MKIRTDYITNSSSSHYIVRNITDSVKTMLDLVKEAADRPWYNADDEESRTLKSGDEYSEGRTKDGKVIPPNECQQYLEKVEKLRLFPPHTDVYVDVSWGFDSSYGSVYIPDGGFAGFVSKDGGSVFETKSFRIRDLPL